MSFNNIDRDYDEDDENDNIVDDNNDDDDGDEADDNDETVNWPLHWLLLLCLLNKVGWRKGQETEGGGGRESKWVTECVYVFEREW